MKNRRWATAVAASLLTLGGCASTSGAGSETHFIECDGPTDCPSDQPYCVDRVCSAEPGDSDAGVGPSDRFPDAGSDSGAVDAGASPGAACLESAIAGCVAACGSADVVDAVCVNGSWQCPSEAPVSETSCQRCADTVCCDVGGTGVMATCGSGGAECPAGLFPQDVEVGCRSLPDSCMPSEPSLEGPFPLTFEVTNPSGADVAIYPSGIGHIDTPCGERVLSADSPETGKVYPAPGVAVAVPWDGYLDRPRGAALAAGTYQISVPVYRSGTDSNGVSFLLYWKHQEFTLPDDDGIVEIPIDDSPFIEPCGDGETGCIVWTSHQDPEAECVVDAYADRCFGDGYQEYRCSSVRPIGPDCYSPWAFGENMDPPQEGGELNRCCR